MKHKTLLILLFLFVGTKAFLQPISIEGSFLTQYFSGDHSFFETNSESIKIEVEGFMAYGFQAGINFGQFNLGIDFLFGNTNLNSENTIEASISIVDINVEYALLRKSLTPLVVAGIGSVNYTESLVNAEGLNESDFSSNLGIGAKWVIKENFYIKPLYRFTFSKIKDTNKGLMFMGPSLSLGYIFNVKIR